MSDIAAIPRPQRWDVPFGPDMTEEDVDRVLSMNPFSQIDADRFPASLPLRKIILNDCRIIECEPGDIVVREGDYGSSLFFVMNGTLQVVLDGMPPELLGRRKPQRKGLLRSLAQLWSNHRTVEHRDVRSYVHREGQAAQRGRGETARIFLQDVPAVLNEHKTAQLSTGQFFGELAALTRMPRTASILAESASTLLEMRWQGFRDIRRRAEAFREHADQLYRERSLKSHLRGTVIFSHLGDRELEDIASQVTFEAYGEFDWFGSYKKLATEDPARRLAHEPIIAEQGHYPNGLVMIRSGFARLSERYGDGERTVSYLGRGETSGFEEIAESFQTEHAVPLRRTVRAVGHVDIIRVPTKVLEQYVLSAGEWLPVRIRESLEQIRRQESGQEKAAIDPAMLEFLVERRFINGTATMLIDLDRCTGCDDCVRACASAHDGNPRFVRHGQQAGHHLVANACMHCIDPVCMIGCPTGAIHRDSSGGQVVINDSTCVGCATCANSCPYHNIRMVEIRDSRGEFILDETTGTPIAKATKCDLCVDQLGGPACQRACPHDALIRIEMADTEAVARYLDR